MKEEQYIKGFNNGYILAKHESRLLKAVTQNLSRVNEYVEGILDGKEQMELENLIVQMQDLNKLRKYSNKRDWGMELL